tara:strand:+ start:1184 stop:1450 length:267 start_codon:yes stop_codon:yes gene_type:complete
MLVFIISGLVFSFRNNSLINVDLLFIQSSAFSVGFWLLSTLLIGFILGMLSTLPKRFFQNIKIHQLSKKNMENKIPSTRVKHESNKGT